MKKLLTALLFVAAPAFAQEADVRAAFDAYRDSVGRNDWTGAAQLNDAALVRQMERVREVTLRATKAELLGEEFWIAVTAVALRHSANGADIEAARGRDFVALANRLAAFPAPDTRALDIGAPRLAPDGLHASAPLIVDGKETDYRMGFVREEGRWRLAWEPLFRQATVEMASSVGITPRTPPDVREIVIERDLFPVLAERSSRPVSPDIWRPLKGRTP